MAYCCAEVGSCPNMFLLCIIFTKSLESSTVPDEWKIGYGVTPIYEKGNRHLPNNYRPISFTSSAL